MERAEADRFNYPPRGMGLDAAARYLGLPSAVFSRLVGSGTLPSPKVLGQVSVWDRLELDGVFDKLKAGEPAAIIKHQNVYTPKTLAKRWHCSDGTIRNMIRRGELEAWNFGGLIRISSEVVDRYEMGVASQIGK